MFRAVAEMRVMSVRLSTLPFCRPARGHILLACLPKSGSTYLSTVLRELTGYPYAFASEPGSQNEQDLSERRLNRLRRRAVLQHHLRATSTNVALLQMFGTRPIVQTRNFFDIVVSLHDHFEQNHRSLSCGHIPEEYWRLSWDERVTFLIHFHLPWFFNFVLSWREAARELDVCTVTYEQLFADQPRALRRIAAFYGLTVTEQQVAAAIERAKAKETRFNVGVGGRGIEQLGLHHRQAILRLADLCHEEMSATGDLAPILPPRKHCAPLVHRADVERAA
jgi:hypothetical protein